eukprot:183277-Rhodomonas_salina.1
MPFSKISFNNTDFSVTSTTLNFENQVTLLGKPMLALLPGYYDISGRGYRVLWVVGWSLRTGPGITRAGII